MTIFNQDFEISLNLSLDEPGDMASLRVLTAKKLAMSEKELPELEIKKHSIDARHGRVQQVLTLGLLDDKREERLHETLTRQVSGEPVIIVGAGPAGLFCAYKLAQAGIAVIICERGKKVQDRRKDLKGLNQHGVVDSDSNYCFGEGGAGTYSDGKLYTRSHKRGNVREVLEILVAHGAKPEILTDARPHIGSNKLPKVITQIRENLERVGVKFLFGARVVKILRDKFKSGCGDRARGVVLSDGREIGGRSVVIATGHSARDVYKMLDNIGAQLEAKAFAMGVRIEHPQALINKIQYGRWAGHQKLAPAYYRLAYTPADGRGAFSFCMCPGGWIVPASTEKTGLVVNGMSLSKRDSPFANSGLVVAISLKDLDNLKLTSSHGALAGLVLQENLERAALLAGQSPSSDASDKCLDSSKSLGLVAPAQRVTDFMRGRLSHDLPPSSYIPGIKSADLRELLSSTGLPLYDRMNQALGRFNQIMPGYVSPDAALVGVESRTSSPVRVLRDPQSLSSNIADLYPCGEGAGYAGGIVSAAIDGMRVAGAIAANTRTLIS